MFKSLKKYLFLLVLAMFAVPALAQRPSPRPTPRATNKPVTARMNACLAKERAIETRMSSLVRFTDNMIEKFTAITLRVQEFYTTKVLPTGEVVPNYDAMIANIEAKKLAIQPLVTKAQSDVTAFSCEGDTRVIFNTFRQDMQAVKQALHEYRTAIKSLIVAVSGVVEEAEATPTPTPSPTPTPTPTTTPET